MNLVKKCTTSRYVLSTVALAMLAMSAQATPLVLNGDFTSISNGSGGIGEFNNATYSTVSNWTSSGYNFVFSPGVADTTGVTSTYGNLQLWGPNNGSANGLPTSSPTGGNYVAADGAFQVGAIQQTINGLTVGDSYVLGFWWAGAQQHGFNGTTTEQWQVSLGSQTLSTAVAPNANHGFTGWMYQTFTFTAASGNEVLSFLSVGTPTGEPPFALLDGVTLTEAPEPGTLTLLLGGLGLLGLGILKSKKRSKS
jgi:hypothetical protein